MKAYTDVHIFKDITQENIFHSTKINLKNTFKSDDIRKYFLHIICSFDELIF